MHESQRDILRPEYALRLVFCVIGPVVATIIAASAQPPLVVTIAVGAVAALCGLIAFRTFVLTPWRTDVASQQDATGLVVDACDRAQARAAFLDAVIEQLNTPVIVTTSDDAVALANAAARERLSPIGGLRVGAALQQALSAEALTLLGTRAREDGHIASTSLATFDDKGDRRQWCVTAIPLRAPTDIGDAADQRSVILVFQDETALFAALAARTTFVANASHELRTPLAAIQGAVETLRLAIDDDPQAAQRFLDMIASNTDRLADIAAQLLDLSSLEAGALPIRCEPFHPAKMLASLDALFAQASAKRVVRVEYDVDPALTGFSVDPWRLWLILQNLVDNAIKHSNQNSAVRVVARLSNAMKGDGHFHLDVIDSGEGIPLAAQQRVFERFHQVDTSRSGVKRTGAGIGLAIVKHAVRELGGEIALESVYGEGTTVRVDLPHATAHAAQSPSEVEPVAIERSELAR